MKLQLVFDEQPRGKMRTNAPAEMVRALNNQGLKVDVLFDEAAHLSQSMKFSKAEKLLKTLILLKPNDVEGLILLIKVLVAQKKWSEALSLTEDMKQKSISIPQDVINFVEKGNERELKRAEIEKQKIVQRERVQLNQLKRDIKRVRKEKNQLVEENNRYSIEIKNWIRASAIISGAALFLLIFVIDQLNKTNLSSESSETKIVEEQSIPAVKKYIQDTGSVSAPKSGIEDPQLTEDKVVESKPDTQPEKPEPQESEPIVVTPELEPSEESPPSFYVVQSGDTLDKIAERFYGKKSHWRIIADHNNVDPRKLRIGMKLEIPERP